MQRAQQSQEGNGDRSDGELRRREPVPPPPTLNSPEPICETLPVVLAERLRAQGLPIAEVARRAGLSREMIRLVLRRKCLAGFPTAAALCRVIGCTLTEVVEEAEERCRGGGLGE